jgi:hypothetical protein
MDDNRHIWLRWIDSLHRWGLSPLVKSVMESMGSLGFIAVELGYFLQPVLRLDKMQPDVSSMVFLLEDKNAQVEFLHCLDEREKEVR